MLALDRLGLGAAGAAHVVQIPAKASSGRLSSPANHVGVLRGFVSAYSQKLVNGTRQRFFGRATRASAGSWCCGCW